MVRAATVFALLLSSCASPQPAPTAPSPPPPADEPETSAVEANPAPNLYRANYGEGRPTLVFLHGGPGYNSALFEASTAKELSKLGQVTIYDRRGAGRSTEQTEPPAYTFEQTLADLDQILEGHDAPILLGHSFGGAVALRYLDARPDFTGTVVLVNAPISYPRSLKTIVANCREVYEAKDDTQHLSALDIVEKMDPTSLEYAVSAFRHGIACGLYFPSHPTPDRAAIMKRVASDPAAAFFSSSMPSPTMGFYANEASTSMDLTELVERHADRVWAVFGEEDRIISDDDRAMLRDTLGARFISVPGAAHNVFIDQQQAFIKSIATVVNAMPASPPD